MKQQIFSFQLPTRYRCVLYHIIQILSRYANGDNG